MADQKLDYRIWRHGTVWRWQVLQGWNVLASGMEPTSSKARIAAFKYCQLREHEDED